MFDRDLFTQYLDYEIAYDSRVNELRCKTALEVWDLYNKNKFDEGFIDWISYLLNTERRALVDACEKVLKERIKISIGLDSKILGSGRSRESS